MESCNPHGGPASRRGFRGRCANEDGADTEVSAPARSEGIQRSVHHTIEPSKFPGRILRDSVEERRIEDAKKAKSDVPALP